MGQVLTYCLDDHSRPEKEEAKYDKLHDDSFNVLLLGAGESGKSTIFKRLVIKHGNGYSTDERASYTPSIYTNTLESIQTLLEKTEDLVRLGYSECEVSMTDDIEDAAQRLMELPDDSNITPRIAQDIKIVWADEGLQNTFQLRHNFQIPGCASYFFDKVVELAKPDYIPSELDMLQCRDRSIGIYNEVIKYHGTSFELTDVGGQRNQRRKWEELYNKAHAVVLAVALSEYDSLCFEDEKTNRMDEALDVFKLVVENPFFKEIPFILVFNKTDIFQEKIKLGHTFAFHGYDGEQTYGEITKFVERVFREADREQHDLKVNFCCALNDSNLFEDELDFVTKFYESNNI